MSLYRRAGRLSTGVVVGVEALGPHPQHAPATQEDLPGLPPGRLAHVARAARVHLDAPRPPTLRIPRRELRRPLGISIVGGLIVSQLLTLYTTPVVYLYLDRFRLWTRRRLGLGEQPDPVHL